MSRNEPGSRIASNLRTPGHLGRVPGQKKKSVRNRVFRLFFEVFQAQEHSWNDPGQVCGKRFSPMFVDFRRNFREVARFFMQRRDFQEKSDFVTKCFVKHLYIF